MSFLRPDLRIGKAKKTLRFLGGGFRFGCPGGVPYFFSPSFASIPLYFSGQPTGRLKVLPSGVAPSFYGKYLRGLFQTVFNPGLGGRCQVRPLSPSCPCRSSGLTHSRWASSCALMKPLSFFVNSFRYFLI